MKCFLLEKVRFKLPGKKPRLIWGVLVSQREGLGLIYIKKPDQNWQDTLTVAIANPQENCWEAANRFVFPLEQGDLEAIGGKLTALGDSESDDMLRELFKPEDLL